MRKKQRIQRFLSSRLLTQLIDKRLEILNCQARGSRRLEISVLSILLVVIYRKIDRVNYLVKKLPIPILTNSWPMLARPSFVGWTQMQWTCTWGSLWYFPNEACLDNHQFSSLLSSLQRQCWWWDIRCTLWKSDSCDIREYDALRQFE